MYETQDPYWTLPNLYIHRSSLDHNKPTSGKTENRKNTSCLSNLEN